MRSCASVSFGKRNSILAIVCSLVSVTVCPCSISAPSTRLILLFELVFVFFGFIILLPASGIRHVLSVFLFKYGKPEKFLNLPISGPLQPLLDVRQHFLPTPHSVFLPFLHSFVVVFFPFMGYNGYKCRPTAVSVAYLPPPGPSLGASFNILPDPKKSNREKAKVSPRKRPVETII